MQLHGIVMTAELVEEPPGGDTVEMVLWVQGVGPGQPRKLVMPMPFLVAHPEIDPEAIQGHAFRAEVQQVEPKRWVVTAFGFGDGRVLRPEP